MPRIICSNITNVQWASLIPQPLVLTDVHVWRVDIAANLHLLDKCAAVLTEDEHQRANNYHNQKDQQRFILARGTLRFLLARYSGLPAADRRNRLVSARSRTRRAALVKGSRAPECVRSWSA